MRGVLRLVGMGMAVSAGMGMDIRMDIGKRMAMALRVLLGRGCLLLRIPMCGRWLGMLLLRPHISSVGRVTVTAVWLCMMWMGRCVWMVVRP